MDRTTTDMSDLAPLVAAVLRDQAVEDLLQENQRLRRENQGLRDRFKVTIADQTTGTILADAADLTENNESDPSVGEWVVDVDENAVSVNLELVGPLEIKIGHRTVETIHPADIRVCHQSDEYLLECCIRLQGRRFPCVPWCWIWINTSLKEEEMPDEWDLWKRPGGTSLLEIVRHWKNFDPELSVVFDRIDIRISAEQVLMGNL